MVPTAFGTRVPPFTARRGCVSNDDGIESGPRVHESSPQSAQIRDALPRGASVTVQKIDEHLSELARAN